MKYYKIKDETLYGIADAIREKNGNNNMYHPSEMATAINQIETVSSTVCNIGYGNTAPEDTGKLWVKTEEPTSVQMKSKLVGGKEKMEMGVSALPTNSYFIAAAPMGEKVYLFGGQYLYNGVDIGYLQAIHEFDMQTKQITTLREQLVVGKSNIGIAAVGTKIYLFGGFDFTGGHSIVQAFDTTTKTLSDLTHFPTAPTYCTAAAAIGTKIYLFGGSVNVGPISTIQVFYTETNTFTILDVTLPIAAINIAAAAIGKKVYLFGGYNGTTALSTIYVFDTETNTLTTLDTVLPAINNGMGVTKVGTKVYLFGGYSTGTGRLPTINVFDTETNQISTLDATLPVGANGIAAVAGGTDIYLFGGRSSNQFLSTINKFSTELPLAENALLIETSYTDNMVNLVANDAATAEIGIANVYLGNAEGYAEKVKAAVYKDGAWVEI